jgi:hypothetical protein
MKTAGNSSLGQPNQNSRGAEEKKGQTTFVNEFTPHSGALSCVIQYIYNNPYF